MARTTLLTLPVKDHIIETLSRNSEMSVRELYQDLRKYFIEKLTAKYPHLSNKEVMAEVETGAEELGYQIPKESAITKWLDKENIREKVREQQRRPAALDRAWCISSCLKENIPGDMVPLLMEFQQTEGEGSKHLPEGEVLTIRVARWISFLYPMFQKDENVLNYIKKKEPTNQVNTLKFYVSWLASLYAKREQISEIILEPFADTAELDHFFVNPDDVDIYDLWMKTFNPEEFEKHQKANNVFSPILHDDLVEILKMELTKQQVDIFNEWLRNQLLNMTEPQKAEKIEKKLLQQYPELPALINAWKMATNRAQND